MWIIQSFRRDKVEYVTKWQSRIRCYMGLMCWAISLNDHYSFALVIRRHGIIGIVPMAVVFIMAVVPMGFTELAIGQFSKCGYINVWRMSPPFKGIGYTCITILALCTMHASLLSSIILHYVRGSMTSPVPWLVCSFKWAKENCFVKGERNSYYMKCVQKAANRTNYCDRLNWESSTEHYWSQVIATNTPILSTHHGSLETLLYTFLTALIVFVILRKGVSTVELFVPFLCVVPHVLQLILFSVSLMLPGASIAFSKFYVPRPHLLDNATLWDTVMRSAFTGTNLGLGGNILFGSESADFRTPIHMAALGIYISNFLLSTVFGLFYCTAISAYSYFDAVSLTSFSITSSISFYIKDMSMVFLPWPWAPQIWALMYYFSLYIMALRNKVLVLHAFISGIYHIFPKLVYYYDLCAFVVIFIDLWFSLLYYNANGTKFMLVRSAIFNNYCTIIVIFYESTIIMYVYGTSNLIDDIHFMLGFRPSAFWKLCWYLCPLISFMVFVLSCKGAYSTFYDLYNKDDTWYFCLATMSVFACIVITPAYMVAYLLRYKKRRKWHKLISPSARWGPADKRLRKSREMFTAHSMTKEYLYRQQRQSRQFI